MKSNLINSAALCLLACGVAHGAILEWDPVTTNADGTAITDLAGYRVFQSAGSLMSRTTQQAMADASVIKTVVNAPATSLSITLSPGTYFFRVTAFDTAGNQSGFNINLSNLETEISTTIPNAPVSLSPLAHWRLDEASGSVAADASGNGRHGTLAGGPVWTTGKVGGALAFDGVDDNVSVANTSALTVGAAFTLTAWVNPTAAMSAFKAVMVKNYSYYLYGSVSGYCGNGAILGGFAGSAVHACDPTPLAPNAWTHLALTYDGAALRIFRNGAESASQAATGVPTATAGGLQLGASEFGEFFPGNVDDARVYNRALSAAEIQALVSAANGNVFDVNADGAVNVTDVQLAVNQTLGLSACTTGDVNKDGSCTVADIQQVVNKALGV